MEVTRDNFLEVLPEIECAIKEADFIAIDGEFTGLGTDLPAKVVYDTPAQRYARLKQGLSNYIIIQYGICTFKWSSQLHRYEAKPFNVYIFPRAPNRNDTNCKFQCQSSSIEFLASQGFDFNKLFYKGLSYVSLEKEASMRQNISKWLGSSSNNISKTPKSLRSNADETKSKTPLFIPEIMKTFVEDICVKVKIFIENDEEKTLELPPCSSFRRKLTYDVIEERFSGLHLETASNEKGDKYIKLIKANAEQRNKLQEELDAKKMAEFETAVGFLKIAKMLSDSKKLVIGHNMLLDTMLTIGQFFTPLPETLDEFKQLTQTVFPKVVDTKLLATMQPLKDKLNGSRLGDLYACVCENFIEPKIELCENFNSYGEDTDKFHEAGYDAFCTGVCFAKMANHLCSLQHPGDLARAINLEAQILQPFINRIYVMRINDLTYINMAGLDDIPERKNVFHVTFPSTWRYSEINSLFNDYGHVHIAFLNGTSALVSLSREDLIDTVLQDLILNKTPARPFDVTTYAHYAGMEKVENCNQNEQQINSNKTNRKRKSNAEDPSISKRAPKKKREKCQNQSLEEGELSDSSGSSSAEDTAIEEIHYEKLNRPIESNKESHIAKPIVKDFYEPEDW